jgi:hypothetical protein
MKKEKMFEIIGTFEISMIIPAKNRKEAKAFAEEEFGYFVNVDTNQLHSAVIGYKKQTKKPKVREIVEEQEQGETQNETTENS